MPVKPELLAPAGSWEALVAAVENGADAVYLGGKQFSARQSAANFDNDDIKRAVDFAHVRDVKVYVAVNTLIAREEMRDALVFLHFLHNCGVDAAIVQDLGLARLARRVLPELPLHASTQMTVHNTPGVQELMASGFERIVLAREMSLQEIAAIKETAGAELEVFIHGALCVCYSGQCLLSSMIGGRSGNRGRCAQPCRMQYALVDHRGKALLEPGQAGEYLLSPRDLNMSQHIPRLIEAGIDSLKIEGRMKRPEYVATVIRIYRELIDHALSRADFEVKPEQARDLAQIFNRDFTTGYFYGPQGRDLMSDKRPNNRGLRLGRIKRVIREKKMVELTLEEPLRVGDGLEVWVTDGGRIGSEVYGISKDGLGVERAAAGDVVSISLPGKIRPGDRVFKTHDADLMERARISFTSPREQKKVPLDLTLKGRLDEPLVLTAKDPEGREAVARTNMSCQRALNKPLTLEYLRGQLDRLGNTPYEIGSVELDLEEGIIIPVREINDARRRLVEDMSRARAGKMARKAISATILDQRLKEAMAGKNAKTGNRGAGLPSLAVSVGDLSSLYAAVDSGADAVYFGEGYRSKGLPKGDDLKNGAGYCKKQGVKFIYSTPRILKDGDLRGVLNILEGLQESPVDGVLVGNLGLMRLIPKHSGLPIITDGAFNVFNPQTVLGLLERGAFRVTLSPELTLGQVKTLAGEGFNLEVLVHGALELMVSEYCAMGGLLGGVSGSGGKTCSGPCGGKKCGLRDRTGAVFPVELDQYCRMHVFNSRDLCLIEDVGALAGAGVAALRVEGHRENAEYVSAVVSAYRRAIDMCRAGNENKNRLSDLKEALARYSPAGYTKGHFYRGVL